MSAGSAIATTVIAVNRGRPGTVAPRGRAEATGIFKEPVAGRAAISTAGLEGDIIVSTRHHGGPDQAIYLYSAADYAWWSQELGGTPLPPGSFGENLTLGDWWAPPRVGDRLRIGEVELQISGARIPCGTLAARMGDPGFVKRFARARRPGCYARVLVAGKVGAGDTVTLLESSPSHPTVNEVFDQWYLEARDPQVLRRLLQAPLAERAAATLRHWLAQVD